MGNTDFSILLQAELDKSGISTELQKIQEIVKKYHLELTPDLQTASLRNQFKSICQEMANDFNKTFNTNVSANDIFKVYENKAKQLQQTIQQVNKIQLSLDNGHGVSQYQNRIQSLINDFQKYGVATENAKAETKSLQQILDSMKGVSGQELIAQADKFEQEFKAVKISINEAKLSYDKFAQPVSDEKVSTLIVRIQRFLDKNTNITKEAQVQLSNYIQELNGGNISLTRWNAINTELKKTESTMSVLGRLGKSFSDQIKDVGRNVTSYLSVSSAFMSLFSKTRESISELKEIDTLLTEISKANDKLSKSDLSKIGNDSFDVASKYGKKATDYLSGVQEASRAGYENAMGIAELSVAAQGAGDMTDNLANKYIIATDKAYKLGGSVEKLTEVLDGSNFITNHNAVNMTELAEGMSIVGSTAASFGIEVNETTAALGTMIASTQQSGSEMARAFRAILLNIRQVSDEEENIDAEGLTKYEKACNALGVSLKETKDGILQTRNAMDVLKELSIEYNELEENDLRRTELLNSVGGKLRANALDAILKNYDMYSKMLDEYSQGSGSMAVEAEKTAQSWEGSLNRLSNTWTDTVENVANSDAIINTINGFNDVLSVINNVTDALGSLGTIGLGAGIFAGLKNVGMAQLY